MNKVTAWIKRDNICKVLWEVADGEQGLLLLYAFLHQHSQKYNQKIVWGQKRGKSVRECISSQLIQKAIKIPFLM